MNSYNKYYKINNMTNNTNVNDKSDVNYSDPGLIFVGLILLLAFCSISYGMYIICYNDTKGLCKKNLPCLYKVIPVENEVRYYSDSDSDYGQEDSYYSQNEVIEDEINIKSIPTFANVNKYSIYCSICQESVLNSVKIDCGHSYCKECILEYTKLGRECPNCRKEIKGIYEIEVLVFEIRFFYKG